MSWYISNNEEDYNKDSKINFEANAAINLTIEQIAKAIANKSSDAQAIFFNEFAKWVNIICEEHGGRGEMQFMYIGDDLNDESLHMIESIVYQLSEKEIFLKSKEKDR